MKTIWIIAAGICGLVAAAFLFRRDFDKAFVVAAIGAVSWFLSYRVEMKELVGSPTKSDDDDAGDDFDDEI